MIKYSTVSIRRPYQVFKVYSLKVQAIQRFSTDIRNIFLYKFPQMTAKFFSFLRSALKGSVYIKQIPLIQQMRLIFRKQREHPIFHSLFCPPFCRLLLYRLKTDQIQSKEHEKTKCQPHSDRSFFLRSDWSVKQFFQKYHSRLL